MKLQMQEAFTNETEGYIYDDTPWYEPYTDNLKRLFLDCQREYGRCVSSIYYETHNNPKPIKSGWYFERKEQYEDTGRYGRSAQYYIRGVWVSLRWIEDEEENAA